MADMVHRSGYVNIIGNPNVGKSTLMNALVGEKMSVITSKPQTTRHRILGIVNDPNFQMIFSDSPGIIDVPHYEMQKSMNRFAYSSFEDADLILFVTHKYDNYEGDEKVLKALKGATVAKYLIINKIDQATEEEIEKIKEQWAILIEFDKIFMVSALDKTGVDSLKDDIYLKLPEGPAYYPKDQMTDKPERFFVSEIIREQILKQFKKEVPYSCEVVVDEFKEEQKNEKRFIKIHADIFVSRKSQKSILIGKGGTAIKKLGIASRLNLEEWFEAGIYLELNVRVKDNWRDSERWLKSFGYQ